MKLFRGKYKSIHKICLLKYITDERDKKSE